VKPEWCRRCVQAAILVADDCGVAVRSRVFGNLGARLSLLWPEGGL
jgi:hypothetical protein